MSFKEKFIELCNSRCEAPSAVCVKVGITPATYSCWTNESKPRQATLMRIAKYFGVSVDVLLGNDQQSPSPMTDDDLKFALFGGDKDIPDKVLEEVKAFAKYAKERYGNK